jgi:tRNA C32,U32 (ribose-2'-O)-methylase TrmJ
MSIAVALTNPKYLHNVAGALRACAAFGVDELRYTGDRAKRELDNAERPPREFRMKAYSAVTFRHCALSIEEQDAWAPVAVEARDDFLSLPDFEHPADALYVFGPEDGSLGRSHLRLCHHHIRIPSSVCLNLAASVYIILYDRRAKSLLAEARCRTLE